MGEERREQGGKGTTRGGEVPALSTHSHTLHTHSLSLTHTHTHTRARALALSLSHTHTRTLHRVGAYLVTFLHALVVSHKVTPPAAAFTSAICRFKEEGRMFKPILVLMAVAFTSAIFRFHSDDVYGVGVRC